MKLSLYTRDISYLSDRKLFDELLLCVPASRRDKIMRYRFERDRMLSLGAWLLLGEALDTYVSCLPSGVGSDTSPLSFLRNHPDFTGLEPSITEEGKPYFPEYPDLHFNISHSGTYVMAAVSGMPCGCDIQTITHADMALAERFFAPEETSLIRNEPEGPSRDLLFTRIWTLKESYIKAIGRGLSVPLDSFAVMPAPMSAGFHAELLYTAESPGTSTFSEYKTDGSYAASACVIGQLP